MSSNVSYSPSSPSISTSSETPVDSYKANCLFNSAISSRYRRSKARSSVTSFTTGFCRILFAREANLSVLMVSSTQSIEVQWLEYGRHHINSTPEDIVIVPIMATWAQPLRDFCSTRVSLLSRKGMWDTRFVGSVSLKTTWPRVRRLRLI